MQAKYYITAEYHEFVIAFFVQKAHLQRFYYPIRMHKTHPLLLVLLWRLNPLFFYKNELYKYEHEPQFWAKINNILRTTWGWEFWKKKSRSQIPEKKEAQNKGKKSEKSEKTKSCNAKTLRVDTTDL